MDTTQTILLKVNKIKYSNINKPNFLKKLGLYLFIETHELVLHPIVKKNRD